MLVGSGNERCTTRCHRSGSTGLFNAELSVCRCSPIKAKPENDAEMATFEAGMDVIYTVQRQPGAADEGHWWWENDNRNLTAESSRDIDESKSVTSYLAS